jgi:hypothetical protein
MLKSRLNIEKNKRKLRYQEESYNHLQHLEYKLYKTKYHILDLFEEKKTERIFK